MPDPCYYKGKKIILVPSRKDYGKWVCQFTIPGFQESAIGQYRDHSSKEYETEQEAETAAFERSKKVLDASPEDTTEG